MHAGTFPHDYVPTIFENSSHNAVVDGVAVALELVDTAGQEGYENLRPLSYPETDVFLIVFDVTNPGSLRNVQSKWLEEIKESVPNPRVVLVGNKCDLTPAISEEEMHRVARTIGAAGGIALQCSALNDEGVSELFDHTIRSVLSKGGGDGSGGCCVLS